MDLTKFNERYRITSQEPVEIVYDIILKENVEEIESITRLDDDLINHYEEQDGMVWADGTIHYFIYEGVTEIFFTTNEEKLVSEIKRLARRIEIEEESLTEEQAWFYLKELLKTWGMTLQAGEGFPNEVYGWVLLNHEGNDDLVLGFAGDEDTGSELSDYELHMFKREDLVEVEAWRENYLVKTYKFPLYQKDEVNLNLEKEMLIEDFIDEVTEVKRYRERIVEADTSYGIIYDDKEVDKLAKELGVKIIE